MKRISLSLLVSRTLTPIRVINTFHFTILSVGNNSIGILNGSGNLGFDDHSFPMTEPSGSISISGVPYTGYRVFNNTQFTSQCGSSVAPHTSILGSTYHPITQTVDGGESFPATITVNVSALNILQTLTSSLIADYKFSGNALDETSKNYGTLQNNSTLTFDRFGKTQSAYIFNGSNQNVSTANLYVNPGNYSISRWFKTYTTIGFIETGLIGSVFIRRNWDRLSYNYNITKF